MSNAFPFAIPLAISTKTMFPKFLIAVNKAIVPPIFPAPINDIFVAIYFKFFLILNLSLLLVLTAL